MACVLPPQCADALTLSTPSRCAQACEPSEHEPEGVHAQACDCRVCIYLGRGQRQHLRSTTPPWPATCTMVRGRMPRALSVPSQCAELCRSPPRRCARQAACEPSEHEPEGVSFSHIWYAGTYHYAQACDCRVRICMCPGSDEPRVQQGNCSEPRSPSIFPNLRLGSRTTFVPIRPKTEAPRRAAELSQLSASAWLHAADRALRDEKKCFPLKDELLALGWASSTGTCSRWSFGGGR